jgi:hypothetical protein
MNKPLTMTRRFPARAVLLSLGTLALAAFTSLSGCVQVKEYQKSRLNDAEMSLGNRKVEKNELNFQGYREGSSGANGGKTGGGCGCN